MGCLYQIEFKNGQSYVGITAFTVERRFAMHEKASRNTTKKNYLYNAMRKHRGKYSVKTLAITDDWNYLCLIEQRAIQVFKTKYPSGYNLTDGGEGTQGNSGPWKGKKRIFSVEHRAKLAASLKGNTRAAGCVHTPEGKERMSWKNREHTEESKIKQSKSMKIRWAKRKGEQK